MNKNAVKSILYALNTISPKATSEAYDSSEAWESDYLASHKVPQHTRIWFRYKFPASRRSFYVSYNPPETRLQKPLGKSSLIINRTEIKNDKKATTARTLQRLREIQAASELSGNNESLSMQVFINNTLNEKYRDIEQMFWLDAVALASDRDKTPDQICWPLYEKYFFSFLLPGYVFNPAMALVRIQMRTGKWLSPGSIESSSSALSGYLLEYSKNINNTLEYTVELGNLCYENGNVSIKYALNSYSMERFYYYLFLSFHEFFTAELLKLLVDKAKSRDANNFRYDQFRADEGCACANTGLWFQIDRRFKEQYPDPTEILLERIKDGRLSEAEVEASKYCKPTNPILPKPYIHASLAIAKIYEDSPLLKDGIAELEEIRNEYLANDVGTDSFEYKRILDSLLKGYVLSNDEVKIEKLTAEMLVNNVLSDALHIDDTRP